MNKIKIAFVETNCKKNGPIKQTWNIIRHMDRDVFEPMLVTVWPEEEGNSMIDEYRNLGITVRSAGLSKKKSILLGKKKVGQILNELKPDIVQGVGMPPYRMSLGCKTAVPFVTLRNYCYEDYPDQYGKMIGTIMAGIDLKFINKQMKKGLPFVTCSESLTKIYKSKHNMDIPFIRNGVDINKYQERDLSKVGELRTKLNLPQDKIIFVYSGKIIDRKNQREAIEAFLKMQDRDNAVLLLLGDGTDYETLKNEYAEYKDIIFKGAVSNVEEYLHASDVYIATSKSEGLPNGVLEAMACGIPVLLSDIPQHMEVLEADEKSGHSYKLGDVNMLTTYMNQMMEEDLHEMGKRSYKAAKENFTAEIMSKKYQDLYRLIVKR